MLCTQSGLRCLCPSSAASWSVHNRRICCEEQLPLLHTILARRLSAMGFLYQLNSNWWLVSLSCTQDLLAHAEVQAPLQILMLTLQPGWLESLPDALREEICQQLQLQHSVQFQVWICKFTRLLSNGKQLS